MIMVDYNLIITDEPLDYCVYAHINRITAQVYVGITNNPKIRWTEAGYRNCPDFYPAIQEYGWDSFEHIVIIDHISRSMALVIEHELIKKYDLVNNGYNRSYGSWDTTVPRTLSRPVYQYTLTGEFVQKWNYATEAVAEYGEGVYDNLNKTVHKAKGYQWSYEYVDKMPPYETEKIHNYLPIYQYSIDGDFIKEWQTRIEATESVGVTVLLCASGKARTAGGYRWSYEKVEQLPKLPPINYPHSHEPRGHHSYGRTPRIYQYDFYGNLIKIHDNVGAIDDPNAKLEFIYRYCKERSYHIQNNMLWVYEDCATDDFIQPIIEKYRKTHYKIIQYDINGNYQKTFSGYKEIEEECGFDPKVISNACHEKISTAYGHQWRSEFSPPPGKVEHYKKAVEYTQVIQKTLDGEIVNIFKNAKEAAIAMNAKNTKHILNVCNGRKKTGYGYLWEFADNEQEVEFTNG